MQIIKNLSGGTGMILANEGILFPVVAGGVFYVMGCSLVLKKVSVVKYTVCRTSWISQDRLRWPEGSVPSCHDGILVLIDPIYHKKYFFRVGCEKAKWAGCRSEAINERGKKVVFRKQFSFFENNFRSEVNPAFLAKRFFEAWKSCWTQKNWPEIVFRKEAEKWCWTFGAMDFQKFSQFLH